MAQEILEGTQTDEQALDHLMRPSGRKVRLASVLTALSSLIWPLQAAIVALAIAGLLDGQTGPSALVSAAAFAGLGLIRAALVHHAEGLLFDAGTSVVTVAREEIVRREMRTTDSGGAGSIAALANEKARPRHPLYHPSKGPGACPEMSVAAGASLVLELLVLVGRWGWCC